MASPLCHAESWLLWFSRVLWEGPLNGKPRSLLRSGFAISASSASNLPDSLRYAPAMMLMKFNLVPACVQKPALFDARRHVHYSATDSFESELDAISVYGQTSNIQSFFIAAIAVCFSHSEALHIRSVSSGSRSEFLYR